MRTRNTYTSSYQFDPKGQKYLDDLANYNPNNDIGHKLGAAGQWAKNIIKNPGQDVSQYIGAELGVIKGEAARDKEIAGRRIAGTLSYANQPGIAAAQTEAAMRARDLNTGQQVVGAARGVRSEALQTFLQAKAQQQAQQRAIAQLEFAKREAANRSYLDSFKLTDSNQEKGKLDTIGQILKMLSDLGG